MPPRLSNKGASDGILGRCIFIAVMTLLLYIPLLLVEDLVRDRNDLYLEASRGIAANWGMEQTVSGPMLVIPYYIWRERTQIVNDVVNSKMEPKEIVQRELVQQWLTVLPSDLQYETDLKTEVRYRGIYHQTLYTAPITISGTFTLPDIKEFSGNLERIDWQQAWLALGISDLKTIGQTTPLQWDNVQQQPYKPGTQTMALLGSGLHAPVALRAQSAGTRHTFSMGVNLRGSGGIAFTPVGENTRLLIKSDWTAPSFKGAILPTERTISDAGFTAQWQISNLTRTYPQLFELTDRTVRELDISRHTVGVNLYEEMTVYRMATRAVKYGILFIVVTFASIFAFEMAGSQRMHQVQYILVGLSMAVFYLMLLSLAEHVSFNLAFMLASALSVCMNSLYVKAALRSWPKGALMAAILTGLYLLLFSILRLEDFALLMGTALVVTVMGCLMYITRHIPAPEVQAVPETIPDTDTAASELPAVQPGLPQEDDSATDKTNT